MALAAIVKTLDGMSDAIKAEYKAGTGELAGQFVLDVTPVGDFALENVKGLKSALASERTGHEAAKTSLKAFEGIDVEKAKAALKKVEDLANGKADDKTKEQIEAIKRQLEDKHTGVVKGKEDDIAKLTRQLEKVMIEAAAIKAITDAKGSAELLLPHVKAQVRMKANDKGEYMVEVVGADGNPRISPATGSTGPMTIAELVTEMKGRDTYAPAFAGSGASGSGAKGSQKVNASGQHVISAADARDHGKYVAAKANAEKAGCQLVIQE